MAEKERLVELITAGLKLSAQENTKRIKELVKNRGRYNSKTDRAISIQEALADYLLENGVIVSSCKVGDLGMTKEEAVKQLDSLINNSKSFHEECGDIWERDIEALNLAKQVLEKQIPKREPNRFYDDGSVEYICPTCSCSLRDEQKYCDECGQRIEWEVVNAAANGLKYMGGHKK